MGIRLSVKFGLTTFLDSGWLFRRKGLIFVMPGLQDAGQFARWTANESRIVTVLGLKEQGENGRGEEADCDASNLSMLLRLQGPEALAEVGHANRNPRWWDRPCFAVNI